MDAEFAFRGLEPFKLSGVTVSEQGMGQDGYGTPTDLELDYRGLKCVGKMAFELLLLEEELVQKFKENCLQLSKLRHPNIVQFLGIFFQEGITAPILVTEFLPITLSFCIDQYGRLPEEISFSILHDVALGLSYLHSQMPALFHGNLSSNTVLLDTNMKAKLSDLGTLSLTPLQITHVTQSPEAMVYVPPEAITSDPKFNVSIDVYAYGILMVHVFSGKWPNITTNDSADEANRRDQFLHAIGSDHPLTELIVRCINVDPQQRPHAYDITQELSKMVSRYPASFANRLDMLKRIKEDRQSLGDVTELKKEVDQGEKQLCAQNLEIDKLKAENENLRTRVARNGELVRNTILALQLAQQKRQGHLKLEVQIDSPKVTKKSDQLVKPPVTDDITSPERSTEESNSRAQDDTPGKPRRRSTRAGSATGGVYSPPPIYIGKYDFEALSDRDMSFKTDTKMFIIDKSQGNWWYARNMETLQEGYVPTNYITEAGSLKDAKKDIKLVKKIGAGDCFEVWEGLWNHSVPIAIKMTTPNTTLSPNLVKELEAMRELHHPNLVSFYISCTNDGVLCLIMELMKCGTLLDYVRHNRQSLSPQQQVNAAAQIASGMAYLEQNKYSHCNLAARNVMLTEGQVCKVADYGMVKLVGRGKDGSGGSEFSPRWTAPEAYEDGIFSIKSDVWSYGTVLYEIITFGKFPYHGLTNPQVIHMIKEGSRIPCPKGCQQKFYNIMLSCWSLSPDDRPSFQTLKGLTTEYFNTEIEDKDDYVDIFQ